MIHLPASWINAHYEDLRARYKEIFRFSFVHEDQEKRLDYWKMGLFEGLLTAVVDLPSGRQKVFVLSYSPKEVNLTMSKSKKKGGKKKGGMKGGY